MLKKLIIKTGVVLLIITGVVLYTLPNKPETKIETAEAKILLEEEIEQEEKTKEAQTYKVDIKGHVKEPGVYSLKEESRVIDVINLAGGLLNNANTFYINLSMKIFDEMVIVIYSDKEIENYIELIEEKEKVIEEIKKDHNNDSLIDDETNNTENETDNGLININTATKEELMSLPGIGEVRAQDIIIYRNEIGGFTILEEIISVSGIGTSTFDQIKNYITL